MRIIISFLFSVLLIRTNAQDITLNLKADWEFSKAGTNKWYPATVPGTVHTDLLANNLIPDPFYADNELRLKWIDSCDWIYRTNFERPEYDKKVYDVFLRFDGLDTYADVYLNQNLVLKSENMFVSHNISLNKYGKPGKNELKIIFHSALITVNNKAKAALPLILPDNNHVYARKAQYQFGWDWGPTFIGCGIWKQPVFDFFAAMYAISSSNESVKKKQLPMAKLMMKKDSIGESFYFEKDSKPVYIKGANWIPANIFLPSVTKSDYRKLLLRAKDANMNMLRVWGGGIYEDDYFYDLCDSLGIMVWQDFMFAGGMYPADKKFMANVKEEVHYQVNRLKEHPCIVLWCGNNEIDEAWKNWGWQDQFKIHGKDSALLWKNYKTLFEDSIPAWLHDVDKNATYIPTSPRYGWGHKESFTEGDSHYWGLWWGLERWEAFETHTGRFVSEWGMQSMPNYSTVKTYVPKNDLRFSSAAVQSHQKANEGFKKLNFYIDKYFVDSAKLKNLSLEEYTYLTQCLQYYILKNTIAVQRNKEPYNMGTLLWQLNDCWPVTSWSITDYSRSPKAGWYAVKEAYRDDVRSFPDTLYPKNLLLKKPSFNIEWQSANSFTIQSDADAKYVFINLSPTERILSDNYFDLKAGEVKKITLEGKYFSAARQTEIITSLYDILNK